MKPVPKEPQFDVPLYYDAKRMEDAGLLRPGTALAIASASKTNETVASRLDKVPLAPMLPQKRRKR